MKLPLIQFLRPISTSFVVILIILNFSINSAHSDEPTSNWPQATYNLARVYEHPFKDPYFSTAWTICKIAKRSIPTDIAVPAVVKVHNPHFDQETTAVKVYLQKDESGVFKKAPLAVFLPGLFSDTNSNQSINTSERLIRLGYHVLSLPNIWSIEYINQLPKADIRDIKAGSQSDYYSIRTVYRTLSAQNIIEPGLRIIGVSRGSLNAAVIGALDSEHASPIIDGDITLFSPPFNMRQSREELDEFLEENKDEYANKLKVKSAYEFGRICLASKDEDLPASYYEKIRGSTAWFGFHRLLRKSVRRYHKTQTGKNLPRNLWPLPSPKYQEWKLNLNFSNAFDSVRTYEADITSGEPSDIFHWLDIIDKSNINVRALSSIDDYVNSFIPEHLTTNNLNWLFLKSGGHFGHRAPKEWYNEFFNAAFSLD